MGSNSTVRSAAASDFGKLDDERQHVTGHETITYSNHSPDRLAYLWVQLDAKGTITKVAVIGDSGAEHLDEEAVRAMNAAGPFPNPPDGLVDSTGHIEFDFGFTLDFVEGSQRIFRYRG